MRASKTRLGEVARGLRELLSPCQLCPNACGVDRLAGEIGRCGVGLAPRVASFGPHFGEEAPLVGRRGSGTVFFSGCSLACLYCQNAEISQACEGTDLTVPDLAEIFLRIEERGCPNLNLVTPTHQAHAIVDALSVAASRGFELPVVWNCGGYESVDVLRRLDGIVDLYMPDLKYGDSAIAEELSGISEYVARSQEAVREMHRQVGDLELGPDGRAVRGLLVRHLVLPDGLAGTDRIVSFLADEISRATFLNVMDQYHPAYRAFEHPSLRRRTTRRTWEAAVASARACGLHRFA